MFIHFAFGGLARQGKIEEQTNSVIELILKMKRLIVSKCTEFIPIFPDPNSKSIPLKPFRKVEGRNNLAVASIDTDNRPSENLIRYLPEDVPMISFIKMSFKQLKKSRHAGQYGKFGIVLTNDFLVGKGIRDVYYYTEESLYRDQLILRLNTKVAQSGFSAEKTFEIPKEMQKEIASYRKPASLFPSFKYSVSHIIKFDSKKGVTTDFFTYNRYPEGYDFRNEQEYRIVFDDVGYLCFDEDDVLMIITPDSKAKDRVESFLKQNWSKQPKVEIFS